MPLDDISKKELFKLELIGSIFTIITGTLLHFAYDWSQKAVWSILFGAVNESVWEHVKIFTLPYIVWSIIEIAKVRVPIRKFVVSKTVGLYFLIVITIIFFYIYSGILGKNILLVDIISIIIWVFSSHFISYKLVTSNLDLNQWFTISCFLILLFIAMFFTFTVNPPQIDLFRDPITGLYGIIPKSYDCGAIFLENYFTYIK